LVCCLRLMSKGDIPQVSEIDHEAFPTMWPPPNYRRELGNRIAHYIVAYDDEQEAEEPTLKTTYRGSSPRFLSRLRRLFSSGEPAPATKDYIFGFAGFWILAGEVHITNIAVREKHRRRGMGELMLISLINMAMKLEASLITLEVRASNTAAQDLYSKYGFAKVGVRRGYYSDNREDGVLMSLEAITSAPVQENLQQLKRAHLERWGMAAYNPDHHLTKV
jgi:ribosomal-protein-alanine N-acetyltransferase